MMARKKFWLLRKCQRNRQELRHCATIPLDECCSIIRHWLQQYGM